MEKELGAVDEKIKKDIENVHLTYNNMDDKEKEVHAVQEQLKHVDIPKDLIMPEHRVAFADLVDELEELTHKKSAYH